MEFKDVIRQERNRLNLSQEQLAVKLSTTRQNITNWENGYSVPPFETLSKISDFFNCSIDYLTGKSSYKNIDEYVNDINKDINNVKFKHGFYIKTNESPLNDCKQAFFQKLQDINLIDEKQPFFEKKLDVIVGFLDDNRDTLKTLFDLSSMNRYIERKKVKNLIDEIENNTILTLEKYNDFKEKIDKCKIEKQEKQNILQILSERFQNEAKKVMNEIDKFNDLN